MFELVHMVTSMEDFGVESSTASAGVLLGRGGGGVRAVLVGEGGG